MEWALVDGVRRLANAPGMRGVCPGCGGEVQAVAVASELVAPHWRHLTADCDPWSEPESEWHRGWKARFPVKWQEVTMGPHRADVAGPDGVLEIQKSGISPDEIREREGFYGRMVWLLNGWDFWYNLVWLEEREGCYRFRWKHMRRSWFAAAKPLLIDTPMGLFRVERIRDGSWTVIEGKFIRPEQLMLFLDRSRSCGVNAEWLKQECQWKERRDLLRCAVADLSELHRWFQPILRRHDWHELHREGVIPAVRPVWLNAFDAGEIREWVLHRDMKEVVESIDEWKRCKSEAEDFLASQEELRKQQIEDKLLEDEIRWERSIEAERQRQLALQAASKASREEYERFLAQRAEEKRREEIERRVKVCAATALKKAQPLAMEWRRGEIVDEFLNWRGAPVGGFGRFDTAYLQSCVKSLQRAGVRGSSARVSQ